MSMTAWFGEPWNPHVCQPETRIPTPVGELCIVCEKAIEADHQGVVTETDLSHDVAVYHLDCFLWTIGLGPQPEAVSS